MDQQCILYFYVSIGLRKKIRQNKQLFCGKTQNKEMDRVHKRALKNTF